MDLQQSTCLALGITPQHLALRLRTQFDQGAAPVEILAQASALSIHPVSIAVAPVESPVWQSPTEGPRNREVARELGLEEPWISWVHWNGLQIKDQRLTALPPGLVLPRLDLSGIAGLTELPEDLCVTSLALHRCHRLTRIPAIRGLESLDILDCRRLSSLPEGLHLDLLTVEGCPALEGLPSMRAAVASLKRLPALRTLPDRFQCRTLDLAYLPLLQPPECLRGISSQATIRVTACRGFKDY